MKGRCWEGSDGGANLRNLCCEMLTPPPPPVIRGGGDSLSQRCQLCSFGVWFVCEGVWLCALRGKLAVCGECVCVGVGSVCVSGQGVGPRGSWELLTPLAPRWPPPLTQKSLCHQWNLRCV